LQEELFSVDILQPPLLTHHAYISCERAELSISLLSEQDLSLPLHIQGLVWFALSFDNKYEEHIVVLNVLNLQVFCLQIVFYKRVVFWVQSLKLIPTEKFNL
jgi:hypothetical protein